MSVLPDNAPLQFRDPVLARSMAATLARLMRELDRPLAIMHVCGSHEQAIARFGLRSLLPKALDLIMGPGCPVCVTDVPEVDEGVLIAQQGARIATFGDMLKVPGTVQSLADAQAAGADIDIIYSPKQAVDIARNTTQQVVFFATGFETTAVATAAVILDDPPPNFSVLSAHKYIPPAMEIVAGMPESRIEGFLAAGHAATITGADVFEPFVARHRIPVVIAGFEPIDILAATVELVELILAGTPRVVNTFPRCVTAKGNLAAQEQLWRVFQTVEGRWRGIADIPDGNLRLRDEFAHVDARKRFTIDLPSLWDFAPPGLARQCICGDIMAGMRNPKDCSLFNKECVPENPIGACMVSNEGTCKIWHLYGGVPDLEVTA